MPWRFWNVFQMAWVMGSNVVEQKISEWAHEIDQKYNWRHKRNAFCSVSWEEWSESLLRGEQVANHKALVLCQQGDSIRRELPWHVKWLPDGAALEEKDYYRYQRLIQNSAKDSKEKAREVAALKEEGSNLCARPTTPVWLPKKCRRSYKVIAEWLAVGMSCKMWISSRRLDYENGANQWFLSWR